MLFVLIITISLRNFTKLVKFLFLIDQLDNRIAIINKKELPNQATPSYYPVQLIARI